MIYIDRKGVWDFDEQGELHLISEEIRETDTQSMAARFWESERARMHTPEKLRRAANRLLITAVVSVVFILWLAAFFWETRP